MFSEILKEILKLLFNSVPKKVSLKFHKVAKKVSITDSALSKDAGCKIKV